MLIFDQIWFWYYLRFKRNKQKCNFYAGSMMKSQFCNFADFNKKHKNLGIIFAYNKKNH